MVPNLVVLREIGDAQMLTIGAQENLQRQDLDPLEEAQIIAWAEQCRLLQIEIPSAVPIP
ncbi:MAG TPA: hypothetical protein VNL77_15315 [Roseiflexaceae bacterium]|nr:hypothetical protein [Roseiflexaceae bacterium]